jgi:tRNA threonylcarbamoyladenosine biosynthesis protein TsaB
LKLLAIDTATEQCSVALNVDNTVVARCVQTQRAHADMILPMIQEVLDEAGAALKQLDVIAFGRGPGAFTGVRIAIGVAQGIAFACDLPVIGISNLAAVAQQATDASGEILVCMDARMSEVYWGRFRFEGALVVPASIEQVSKPEVVIATIKGNSLVPAKALGTGFKAYPVLREYFVNCLIDEGALPCATEIAILAARDFTAGLAVQPSAAEPVYLRDQVVHVRPQTPAS